MRNTLILIAAFTLFAGALFYFQMKGTTTTTLKSGSVPEHVIDAFHAWMVKHHEHYAHPAVEEYRLNIFFENYKKIENHSNTEYTVGMNQFMALTKEEFKSIYLGFNNQPNHSEHVHTSEVAASEVDWRKQGDVSPIKDQGQCGSCWAFSTTGSLEAVDREFNNHQGLYSEQELVDCSGSYGNMGCNGGLMDNAFKYVIAKGISTESEYPYTARDGSCKVSNGDKFTISKYTDVTAGNAKALASAVSQQPVSVAVDAENWQFYSGGVFSDCNTNLDHGVLAVGYDSNGNWFVKNSWGTSWGDSGYITLKSGNTCGIANAASYATA